MILRRKELHLLAGLLLVSIFLWSGCAAGKAYRKAEQAAREGDWDRAVGQYIIALNKDPDNIQYKAGLERAKIAASQHHFQKGKELMSDEKYDLAIVELQLALDFDRSNQFIANELIEAQKAYERQRNIQQITEIERAKEEAKKRMQIYKVLGPEADTTIQSLSFHDDSLKHILDSLGILAGINIVYDSDFRDQEFSVSLDNITFRDALEQILVANRLYYKPLDASTILIIPDNPQKRRQYDEQVIQTFYLSNAELNDVLNLIRSVMQIQRIATNPQLNAITLRDTPDKIAIAQKIIEANDKSRSEILLDVEIMEVNRDHALRYGIDLSSYTITQDLIVNSPGGEAAVGQFFGNQLGAIDAAAWRYTVPSIIYRALAEDQRTRILAKPQIRASEGQQVTVRLGDRVPIPVSVIQTAIAPTPGQNLTTFPTTTFQQQDIGINIDVTPRVHHNREITLTMRFELTSITVPGTGATPPTIGNRTVNTVIRLKDGETNLLAGLIRKDERKALRGIPGIVNIPFIRDIFASNDKELQEKDIVFTITPHILRIPNITADDMSPIWIGTEDDVRLKPAPPISVFDKTSEKKENVQPEGQQPLQEEKKNGGEVTPENHSEQEKSGGSVETEPAWEISDSSNEVAPEQMAQQIPTPRPESVVIPVSPQPSEQPVHPQALGPVAITFLSAEPRPRLDTDVMLHVRLEGASRMAGAFIFLGFDATAIQIQDIQQGPFLTPGAFAKSFDNGRGSININANRAIENHEDSGILATIVLRGIKPGRTTLNLNSAVLRDADQNVIPVSFTPYTISFE